VLRVDIGKTKRMQTFAVKSITAVAIVMKSMQKLSKHFRIRITKLAPKLDIG
jgi:hypothetical protein